MQQLQLDNKDGEKLQCNTTTKYVKLFILISGNCPASAPSRPNLGH